MKKVYLLVNLLIAAVLLSTGISFGQSVPNGNFEAWDTGISYPRATGWDSPNEVIATSLFSTNYVVFQESTNPASGLYSAKLESKSISIPFGSPIAVPGFMTLGDFSVNIATQTWTINGGVPFTDRPDKLTGKYKYAPSGSDMCMVQVVLLNYNAATQTIIDTIAEGVFVGTAASSFTEFEAELDYNSTATPNYMNINILSSGSSAVQVGSVMYVDDLAFYTEPEETEDLFFSEYVEGSSNNKALEIYNPTSDTIYLADYRIAQASNAGGWAFYHAFPAGAAIAPGDVWVIIHNLTSTSLFDHANADEALPAPGVIGFNGDDARAIIKISGSDTLFLDILGSATVDPGTAWPVAGVANATAEHTLVRKPGIMSGNTDWEASFGTDATNSEWIVYNQNDFTFLGWHQTTASAPSLSIDSPADGSTVYTSDVTFEFSVANFTLGATADGYVKYTLDGATAVDLFTAAPFTVNSLSLGAHQMIMWLVDVNGLPLVNAVSDTVDFTVSLNIEANIVDFMVPGMIGGPMINTGNFTVTAYVVAGTDLTNLMPDIVVSTGASISPASGLVQDFTNPVTYTVTAQAGNSQAWEVVVTFQPEGDLFFSEYIEGSSNNKALEIYNPTSGAISLDNYRIAQSTNGGGWQYYHTFPVGAVIQPNDVWVIITNQFDGALYAAAGADEVLAYPSVTHHNGDDARAIIKVIGIDTTFVDIIGVPTVDPGTGWEVAGVANATADHTLIRKAAITQGNTNWAISAGTNATDSEWEVMNMNYVNLGTHYTGGNLAPQITNVTILPAIVTFADTVVIAAQIVDTDGTIASSSFDWGLDGINFPNVLPLTQLFNIYSIYPQSIPAHPAGTTVYFRFMATDDLGLTTTQIGSYTVAVDPLVLSIYEIQGQAAASPYNNQIVTTTGIVTGLLPGTSTGYFIQDGSGPWNGVFVYDNVNLPVVGDEIQITAMVSEYYELTELKTVSAYTVLSSGNTLPEPVILSTTAVNDEQYEGVFVKVINAECVNDDYGYGMWQVNDGSGAVLIHNNASFTYTPNMGTHYNVSGVLNYTFSEWKVELRMASDVSEYVSVNETEEAIARIYPNPTASSVQIDLNRAVKEITLYNMLGEAIHTISAKQSLKYQLDLSSYPSGIYFIAIKDDQSRIQTKRVVKQ